jgi:hypothetical protein
MRMRPSVCVLGTATRVLADHVASLPRLAFMALFLLSLSLSHEFGVQNER